MFSNYIKIAFRNLLHHKAFAFINIIGLSISIACATILYLYVAHEYSYDKFHDMSASTYRLIEPSEIDGEVRLRATMAPPVGQALVDEFPDVIASTRIFVVGGHLDFVIDGERFMVRSYYNADSTFFDVFDFEVLYGDKTTAFSQPGAVAITRELANKFFGKVDAVGESLVSPSGQELLVKLVLEDLSENSHLQFKLLMSIPYSDERFSGYLQRWDVGGVQSYIVLNEQSNLNELNEQLPAFIESHFSDQDRTFYLQPLEDIYLESGDIVNLQDQPRGNKFYIKLFMAIGAFMLLIASINYINLATAKSLERSKEIGLRKVSGAVRSQLIVQMFSESMITVLLAFSLAIGMVDLMLPLFNSVTGKAFDLNLSNLSTILPAMLVFTIFVGIVSGSYPAIMLSKLLPAETLRGKMNTSRRGIWLRQSLVVIQFSLSIFMIIATLIVTSQMDYIRNKSLGFNEENLVVVDINNSGVRQQWETVRHEFSALSGVESVTSVSRVPGEWKALNRATIVDSQNSTDTLETFYMCFDEKTLDVFEMSLLEGKNFESGIADTSKIMVNQSLIDFMDWDSAIGQELYIQGVSYPFTVIGVVDDFHFQSLHENIEPMVIGAGNNAIMVLDYFVLKTNGQDVTNVLAGIAKVHDKFDNRTSVEIHFLDDELDRFYKSDIQAGQLFAFGAGLTIFISCLGLFGLMSFFAQMKMKEISIRKVLGASSFQLVVLLSKSFLFQVGIGFIIATPLAWVIMSEWLSSYSYRISMPMNVFFIAGLMAVAVTLITVSYRAIKTSNVNPAKTLKQE